MHSRREQEPSYDGLSLSQWLVDLNYSGLAPDLAARKALSQMGTNILPYLRPMLRARDSAMKLKFARWLSSQSLVKIKWTRAEVLQERAALACRVLGPAAACFAPELTAMLDNQTSGRTAFCGLGALLDIKPRTNCVIELSRGLTNQYSLVRNVSTSVLGSLGVHARPAIRALLLTLDDPDARVREAAVDAVAHFRSHVPAIADALTRRLADTDKQVRNRARINLDEFTLIPALVLCLSNSNAEVRADAACGLRFRRGVRDNASSVVFPLILCLSDTNAGVRAEAAMTLGDMGGAAGVARERLEDCTQDKDERVRNNARQVLRMIR
jgi:HEAT repeat protein